MPASMTFQFLDVGQGDSTLVHMRASDGMRAYNELALIDFGEDKSEFKNPIDAALKYLVNQISATSYLRGKMTPYVDCLYLTHPHKDHFSGIPKLLHANYPFYQGKSLKFGKLCFGGEKSDYIVDGANLIDVLTLEHLEVWPPLQLEANAHSPINLAAGGRPASLDPTWEFVGGNVKVYLLSANFGRTNAANKNDTSLVLLFELVDGRRVCLTGDAGGTVEAHILKELAAVTMQLRVEALKLGHHGSKTSSSANWIKALQPKYVFASGDYAYGGHPFCKTLDRVCQNTALTAVRAPSPVRFCCGERRVYSNKITDKACCMNLWYEAESEKQRFITSHNQKTIEGKKGTVYGVQWGLGLQVGSAPVLEITDYVIPQ